MKPSFKKIHELFCSLIVFCIDRAEIHIKNKVCSEADANTAVDWLYIAASFSWCMNPGYLRSVRIEQILSKISTNALGAARLDARPLEAKITHIVHVATAVSLRGGHTRVIARWIDNCRMFAVDQVHHLVLTGQGSSEIPDWLVDTIRQSGGECTSLDRKSGWIECAKDLREYAARRADVIILHVHPNDPIANLAFSGMKAHLPIFMFNHADHVFSLSVGICSRVLDFRKSGQDLTSKYRGVLSTVVPLPMLVGDMIGSDRMKLRMEARQRLNIDMQAVVALTIGDEYKYKNALGYSFIECAGKLLKLEQKLTLVAIGIPNKNEWAALALDSQSRFIPTGNILDKRILTDYYYAADIYLEGFPFSSLTAMIDAGLNCLPIQRMRNVQLPILSGDDIALDGLIAVAINCEEYILGVRRLICLKPEQRERLGLAIRDSILKCHSGEMWVKTYIAPLFTSVMTYDELSVNEHIGRFGCIVEPDKSLDALAQFQLETRGAFVVTLISMAQSPLSLLHMIKISVYLVFSNLSKFSLASILLALLLPFVLIFIRYVPKKMILRAALRR